MSLSSVHISYILAGISDGEPWYYGRIPIRTWVELPSSYPRRKSGQIFILRKNESGHDRPISDLASKLDVRGPGPTLSLYSESGLLENLQAQGPAGTPGYICIIEDHGI